MGPPGGGSGPPREGDGFTFEHVADKRELWIDFCADTGDGGYAALASLVIRFWRSFSYILYPL